MQALAAAAATYMPDDGTQGYTPYFYKMDVPVRVRNSISYGRAWQLLRSRGAGSNATGPCDPYQLASSCNASTTTTLPVNIGVTDRDDVDAMPRAVPTVLCDAAAPPQPSAPPPRAAILLMMHPEQRYMRFPTGTCTPCLRRGYGKMVRELIRILLSLRAVRTQLPIHVLASGERYSAVEAKIAARFDVSYVTAPLPLTVPAWSSKWAYGSFAKLRALALTQYDRLVVLDNDDVVLRNVDHLASAAVAAPAFVFGWKCHPRRELRASTIVLRPSAADWARASALLVEPATAVYDDLGEQSVWRRLWPAVHELPAGYAAMRTADLPAAEWPHVHIVHDAHLIHDVSRAGWHAAGMKDRVESVDKEATRLFKADFDAHFADPPRPKLPKSKGKGKGRGRRGRLLMGGRRQRGGSEGDAR